MENLTNVPKTIIYLDQLVISNLAKVIDANFPRRERLLKNDPFWLQLYKKLDRLLKLQLIVCPNSCYHRSESMISGEPSFHSLQDVYSYFSNGCTFHDETMILRWQLLHYFQDYIEGHEREPVISASEVVFGRLNEWRRPFKSKAADRFNSGEAKNIRAQREERHKQLEIAFALWQQEAAAYPMTVLEEAHSLGRSILQAFFSSLTRWIAYSLGLETIKSPLDLLPPPNSSLVFDLIRILEENGVSDTSEHLHKVHEYFQSHRILRVPFVRLTSMLYAAIARKAPGMKTPPNRGTTTDITAIASLLPYCHALFVDNEMAGHLRDMPLRGEVERFGTQIFSPKYRDSFMAYLDAIEVKAGERHIRFVEMVYGKLVK